MGLSQNVITETIRALQSSRTQAEAAKTLGISIVSLHFRIKKNPEIEAVAIERGMTKPKKKEPDRSSIPEKPKQEAAPQADLSKAAYNISGESTKAVEITAATAPGQPEICKSDVKYSENIPASITPVFSLHGDFGFFGRVFQVDISVGKVV